MIQWASNDEGVIAHWIVTLLGPSVCCKKRLCLDWSCQGELEGGRNCFWYWQDIELLCMRGISLLTPTQPTQGKTAVEGICHFLHLMLLIPLCMLSILLWSTEIWIFNSMLKPVSPSFSFSLELRAKTQAETSAAAGAIHCEMRAEEIFIYEGPG